MEKNQKITIGGVEYNDFLIGSDPELRFEGIKARDVLPFEPKFGTDGPSSHIGELRPDPSYCPITHVSNIELLMSGGWKKYKQLQKVAWLGGSIQEGHPLGGHIHIDSDCDKDLGLKLTSLDKLLAPVVLMMEDKHKASERRSGQYGKLATHGKTLNESHRGFKTKHNGTKPLSYGGFEYRPLPSWLVSKNIAIGILALAKVISFQTHNEKLHKHLFTQLKFIKLDSNFYDAYYGCEKQFFAGHIISIYRIIQSFKLFPRYERYINYLFQLIDQGRGWEDLRDLKTRWKIVPEITKTEKSAISYSHSQILDGDGFLDGPAKKQIIYFFGEE